MNSEEKESLRTQWQRRGCCYGGNKKRKWQGALEDDPNLNIQQPATGFLPTKKKKKTKNKKPSLASSPKDILGGKISSGHIYLNKHL